MATFKKNREGKEVNTSSTADIAFLLLIIFLVTTTIEAEKGITLILPSDIKVETPVPVNERNLFKVHLNSLDRLLVREEQLNEISIITPMLKEFILNKGKDPSLSVSPKDAVISFKTNSGTSYQAYIAVLDQLKDA